MKESQSKISIFSSTLYFTAASVLARIGGFGTQIVLGWILVKEEYGLFAITLSIASVFGCLRNGGTDQLIIQRGREYISLAPRIATFSIIFNIVVCVLLLAFSGKISAYYKEPDLTMLLIVLAFGYLFATPGPILLAKLSIQKDFREIAIASLITILSKHVLTVILALFGLGIFSLLIPLAMQPLIGAATAYFFVRKWPGISPLQNTNMVDILNRSFWVISSNFAFELSANVQYFIFGAYFPSSIIGVYFFAVQLINSPIALINGTVKSVVFPSLSSLVGDSLRYKNAVVKSVVVSYSIGAIMGVSGYMFLPILTDLIWAGKWNEAIVYIKILCLIIPSGILINTVYEVLASAGYWRGRFYLLVISIVVEVISIWMVIDYIDLSIVVLSIFVFRNFFMITASIISIRKVCGAGDFVELFLLFSPFSLLSILMAIVGVFPHVIINYSAYNGLVFLTIVFYGLVLNRYMSFSKLYSRRLTNA